MMDVSSAWHKSMVEEFAHLKAPLNLRVENAPIETIKKMVAMRLGVGFVPLMCVREERSRGELAVLALDGFHQERSLYMVRRRAVQSHAALAFAKVAVSFGEALQTGKETIVQPKSKPMLRPASPNSEREEGHVAKTARIVALPPLGTPSPPVALSPDESAIKALPALRC